MVARGFRVNCFEQCYTFSGATYTSTVDSNYSAILACVMNGPHTVT